GRQFVPTAIITKTQLEDTMTSSTQKSALQPQKRKGTLLVLVHLAFTFVAPLAPATPPGALQLNNDALNPSPPQCTSRPDGSACEECSKTLHPPAINQPQVNQPDQPTIRVTPYS